MNATSLLNKLKIKNVTVHTGTGNVTMVNEGAVYVLKATGAATTVTLNPSPLRGDFAFVMDSKGDAATNNITVNGAASETINGALTYRIAKNFGSALFTFDGTQWVTGPGTDPDNATGLWAGSGTNSPTYYEIFDHFMNPATSATSDEQAWVALNDGTTGTPVFQDAAGGVFNVVTQAADNDYAAYSSFTECFKFAAGKKLWFEARFKLAEATTNDSAWWFGLSDTLTTGGFQANAAGPLASYDGALIWKDEDALLVNFETSNAGTQATTSNMATFVTDTWTRVGFYFDGTATTSVITPYYDVGGGTLVAGTPQNITLSGLEEMHVVFGVKAGPGGAAETLQVDYIKCRQLS